MIERKIYDGNKNLQWKQKSMMEPFAKIIIGQKLFMTYSPFTAGTINPKLSTPHSLPQPSVHKRAYVFKQNK